ncbi:MAG TPA: hypothetical protein VFY99_07630 [Solirubrobacterales bacterium]
MPEPERLRLARASYLAYESDEVLVTYESEKTDGSRFRNTEVLTFAGEKLVRAEVYFGWDL